jgi:hypothetical protein
MDDWKCGQEECVGINIEDLRSGGTIHLRQSGGERRRFAGSNLIVCTTGPGENPHFDDEHRWVELERASEGRLRFQFTPAGGRNDWDQDRDLADQLRAADALWGPRLTCR